MKKDFFDFFDVEDLINGQKCKISMEPLGGESGVKVTLSMPTAKIGEPPIKFERIYKASVSDVPLVPDQNKSNGGSIVELQFGVNLMPFIRIENAGFNPIYKVQVVDRDIDYLNFSNDYNLKFMDKENVEIKVDSPKYRRTKKQNTISATTKYYTVEHNFDYIIVEVGGKKGVIAPRFDKVSKPMGSAVFTFAVDFGTTTTHIEYKAESPEVFPFDIKEKDVQIVTLHDLKFLEKDRSFNGTGAFLIADIVQDEFLPFKIDKTERHNFPMRSAILENNPNWHERLLGFSDFNPAFDYEKRAFQDLYKWVTNLKWANYSKDEKGEKRIEGYIQSLLLLIRNKILLNEGNLEATQLVWFYPLSMLGTRRNLFERLWQRNFEKIINRTTFPQKISESIAPYYWYVRGSGKHQIDSSLYPAVCIDIGGGTTDVVIFEDDKPTLISSFRFAANAVFGDAFVQEGAADRNGFVQKFEHEITQLLQKNELTRECDVLQEIRKTQRSEDIIAFFFSLKENKDVLKKADIDFNEMLLRDDSFKIIFLIFYTALIYHLAKIMKSKEKPMKMPGYIAFSGNGSKVLNILSNKSLVLSSLAKLIFEKVYNEKYHEDGLVVVTDQISPKEATCKGGLKQSKDLHFDTPDNGTLDEQTEMAKVVLLGSSDNRFVSKKDT